MNAARSSTLARILREQKADILARWSDAVRRASTPRHMDEATLRDSLPILLDRVTEMADEVVREGAPSTGPGELPREHALQRLESGYAIDELVLDYTELRASAYETIEASGTSFSVTELRLLDRAIDHAMLETVKHFVAIRDRRTRAFERLVTGIAESTDLQPMLEMLIGVFMESVPAVDTAAVLILEGDRLVVRATKGLEREKELGFSLRVGEGFAGAIAAARKPILLQDPDKESVVKSPLLRSRGLRVLYGVPLEHGDKVVGVVHMGSSRARAFSDDDIAIFSALASRATAVIAQAHIVEQLTVAAHFREQLVGVVSHDLRTPLNAIVLGANLLLTTEDLPTQGAKTAGRILRAADRMKRMIDQLLDFTRARLGGGIALELGDVALDEVCREVITEIEMANPSRTVVVTTRGDLLGRWDSDRMKQLVSNLVDNAVTHGHPDTPVQVTLDGASPDHVEVRIQNFGSPIPNAEISQIFEPFRQAQRTRAGLGLGLYIAKEVARAHRGTIDVSSSEERGTLFVVRIPRRA